MSTDQSRQKEATALGIDVSHYQGTVEWGAVQRFGLSFALAKATEGTGYVDPRFGENWPEIKQAGLLRGAYHFFRAAEDGTEQAEHFTRTVQLEPGDLPPVLDVEITDNVGNTALMNGVHSWLSAVEQEMRRRPMIYTNHAFWNVHITAPFGHYPLWIAEYGVQAPILPPGWETWSFWQYSEKGTVDGVSGPVDLDRFHGSHADLLAFVQSSDTVTVTVPSAPTSAPSARTYTIQPDDTLSGIAARFGVTVAALMASNSTDNPNEINVGQVLNIP